MRSSDKWYRFFQPYVVIDILIEPWMTLAEYVRSLRPVRIERIRRESAQEVRA